MPSAVSRHLADADLAGNAGAWAATAESALASLRPPEDDRYDEVLTIVADMLVDPSLLTVAQVGARHGLSTRSLQRLFHHYVGVNPKWVLV